MQVLVNEELSKYTTLKIGGIAKKMYIPENIEELCGIFGKVREKYVIGGGSNLLINQREYEEVINLRAFNKKIEKLQEGTYYVGASVRLQELIKQINSEDYGGIEYLYSVPGLVGGAIVMNAGGGKEEGWSISDHIVSVRAFYRGKIVTLSKQECCFLHRNSIFLNNTEYVILDAICKFEKGNSSYFEGKRNQRIAFCKMYQDNNKPNCGSVFKSCNYRIMAILKRIKFGKSNIHFSEKTANWILNEGNATFKEAKGILNCVKLMHKMVRRECQLEVIIWE